MLAIKALIRNSKIILSKIGALGVEIEPGTYCDPLCCPPDWGNLALRVRLRFLRSLFSHALLILAESFKSTLKYSQLEISKFQVQSGKLHIGSQEVPGSISTGGNFFTEFTLLYPT